LLRNFSLSKLRKDGKGAYPIRFYALWSRNRAKKMLIKKTGADTIGVSNPVLADCPPMKGAETMLRTNFNRPS